MRSAEAGFKARAVTDTACGSHPGSVASANVRGALAMNCRRALAMTAAAFAMDGLSILCVQSRLTRPVSSAHDPTKVQAVIVRNFAPAFPSLVQRYKVVEALAGCVSQQVCSLQFTPAKPCRCPLCLQRSYRNSGLSRNSLQIRCVRSNGAEHEKQYRCDETQRFHT